MSAKGAPSPTKGAPSPTKGASSPTKGAQSHEGSTQSHQGSTQSHQGSSQSHQFKREPTPTMGAPSPTKGAPSATTLRELVAPGKRTVPPIDGDKSIVLADLSLIKNCHMRSVCMKSTSKSACVGESIGTLCVTL